MMVDDGEMIHALTEAVMNSGKAILFVAEALDGVSSGHHMHGAFYLEAPTLSGL